MAAAKPHAYARGFFMRLRVDRLDVLENRSVKIMREAYSEFKSLCRVGPRYDGTFGLSSWDYCSEPSAV